MQWHVKDPVDEFGENRNDIIYEDYQENRNPFIDHPEYVEMIYNPVSAEDVQVSLEHYTISNYPNPFNPTTTISFNITAEHAESAELEIYNLKGQKVKKLVSRQFSAGQYSVIWNGDDESGKSVSSGLYFYKLNVNGKTKAVKKCLLLK
ncbi:MAG: T9SS type A sorting domain-containing protein [Candidatus Tenebribacter mawsonii]|nr:T9SS type A sorting domain-containing protein [Candidatus Tenebribacter mawsonii]